MQVRSISVAVACAMLGAGCVSPGIMVSNVTGAARPQAYTADTVWRSPSSGQMIFEQALQAVSVAQLSAPLTVPAGKFLSHRYTTDDLLFEMSNVPPGWRIFCGFRGDIHSGILRDGQRLATQSCLADTESDGQFDRAYSFDRADKRATLLSGGTMAGGVALPSPVAYVRRTDGNMPVVRAGVLYAVAPGTQDRKLTYAVESRGTYVEYERTSVRVPELSASPVLVEVFGARVELRETAPGDVEYRVISALSPDRLVEMGDLQFY